MDREMGGLMDGWVNKWMDGWMCGWIEGWMGGWWTLCEDGIDPFSLSYTAHLSSSDGASLTLNLSISTG